jgi:hypothetical protein
MGVQVSSPPCWRGFMSVQIGLCRLRKNPLRLSFRGAAGDEESRSAMKTNQSEIPRSARNDKGTRSSAACVSAILASVDDKRRGNDHDSVFRDAERPG